MNKILIIGQAPPIKAQAIPYDSTLLYVMLLWAGICSDDAQDMFEFEALTNVFPGINKHGGHKQPSPEMVVLHSNVLLRKIYKHRKIITLGKLAANYYGEGLLLDSGMKHYYNAATVKNYNIPFISLPHPSRRNWKLIHENQEKITNLLNKFIHNG